MNRFSPIEGLVTSVTPLQSGNITSCCTLLVYIQTRYQEVYQVLVSSSTYVLDQKPIRRGDTIIAFYDTTAPMPLIYPPQYQAVAVVFPEQGEYAAFDYFDRNLRNSDNTLVLNLSGTTAMQLPNGQYYLGIPGDQYLLVLYTATTRSIPAQTTPHRIVVFCSDYENNLSLS